VAIAAGEPITAPDSEITNVALTESLEASEELTHGRRDGYALRAKRDSMKPIDAAADNVEIRGRFIAVIRPTP
jgi:SOS-response transcriptional repressor LexA